VLKDLTDKLETDLHLALNKFHEAVQKLSEDFAAAHAEFAMASTTRNANTHKILAETIREFIGVTYVMPEHLPEPEQPPPVSRLPQISTQ
jgi:hypothetical protein